jgi:hypothetical protein
LFFTTEITLVYQKGPLLALGYRCYRSTVWKATLTVKAALTVEATLIVKATLIVGPLTELVVMSC